MQIPESLANLRDVARTIPGVRPGMLLRSDAPHSGDVPPAGVDWPPAVVIDLRDTDEKGEEHPLAEAARVVNLPLMGGRASVPESEREAVHAYFAAGLGAIYAAVLEGSAAGLLVQAITEIAEADGPVLVHCTAGKDRTGVTVAMTLALVGVDAEEIVADYAATAANMPGVLARSTRTVDQRALGAMVALGLPPSIHGADPGVMRGFLAEIDRRGGAEAWFVTAGGSPATLDRLRERLRP